MDCAQLVMLLATDGRPACGGTEGAWIEQPHSLLVAGAPTQRQCACMEDGHPGRRLTPSHLGQHFIVCVPFCFCVEFPNICHVSSIIQFVFECWCLRRVNSIIAL